MANVNFDWDRKDAFKASHPLRKLINVFKNLMSLGEDPYDLVCYLVGAVFYWVLLNIKHQKKD